MSERHKGDMIRASAEPAPARLEKIKNLVADPEMYAADEFKKFGFEVDQKPMEATGTVLEAPTMLDGDNAEIKVEKRAFSSSLPYINFLFRFKAVSGEPESSTRLVAKRN